MIESLQLARVRAARAALLLTHPFFGMLSLRLDLIESDALPTAGVDGKRLIFNPTFVDELTQAELKGVVAHEVMHCALLHHTRMGNRGHKKWNVAADHAINLLLTDDGFTLPTRACCDVKYKDMSAEQIYNLIPDSEVSFTFSAARGATGEVMQAGPAESAAAAGQAREWQENVQAAIRSAQSAGKLPAHIKRALGAVVAPRADWRSILRRFMSDHHKQRPTWSKRNKRFPNVYLPGNVKEGMGAVVIGVDTSGSISASVLDAFAAEIRAIAADAMPAAVHVVYCDADVNHAGSFEHGEEIVITPHGGGGTAFKPVFDYVESEGLAPVLAVYLTDTYGSFDFSPPEYPVLWATYGAGGNVAPWGETVAVDG